MMKRILIFAVVLSLLLPAAAFAATEFSLGGYVKLDTFWDSTENTKNIGGAVLRNNDASGGGVFHHGNLRFTADGSRFNFTIKGPDVLGAKLTGFIEMDFEETADQPSTASNAYIPRLRHAMFRLNWPGDTELIFGQYWSMFCDYFAEAAEDGTFQVTGTPTARLPQIRFTQGFLGDWHVAALVGQANNDAGIFTGSPYDTSSTQNNGRQAETPQIQGQIKYSHDLWGKAAFYGHPMPFTASVTAGWQRNVARPNDATVFGINAGTGSTSVVTGAAFYDHVYVSPWMVQGSLFIPVIPTHSDNLAGTAHIIIQPWIGQGVNAFGMTGDTTNVFKFDSNRLFGHSQIDAELLKRYGLMAEAQYYFTNQWYVNVAYGVTAAMGIDQELINTGNGITGVPLYTYNSPVQQIRRMDQVDATLWWRPIAALKFGVQYAYAHAQFLQDAYPNASLPSPANPPSSANGGSLSNKGDEHRVEFVGFFYF